jgi:hypothetical protein
MDRRLDGEAPGLEARIEALALERRQQAESLRPFDANAWLGEPAGFPLAREMQPPELLRALRGCGIQAALVSLGGAEVTRQAGNTPWLPWAAGEELRACWTGLPCRGKGAPSRRQPAWGWSRAPFPLTTFPWLPG